LTDQSRRTAAKVATGVAISANLCLLGYFKYSGFAIENAAELLGLPPATWSVVLPVGISFYTFTQIAFLVDTYNGRVHRQAGFIEYALFVTYFPHLIAGPILHHAEMIPQFLRKQTAQFSIDNVSIGAAIFVMGLAKKILIADGIAPYADAVFGAKGAISFGDAWIGTLAYTLQLYFDFSGYCDMAIGLSRMFNIDLPLNFYSPYKAASIIEFWRRWHMTLSRFLRDYLYIPLGGNRRGATRRNINLMVTMALGGLWHGAAWTFIIWGVLHGVFLLINHVFRRAAPKWLTTVPGFPVFARLLTFGCVAVAWVFFRAETTHGALHILSTMVLPTRGIHPIVPLVASEERFAVAWIAVGLFIVWGLPNSQQIFRLPFHPSLGGEGVGADRVPILEPRGWALSLMSWRPTSLTAVIYGAVFAVSLMFFVRTARFLYFQF
jgi:D-alanyl-lipoteichoic acid acyltransferase DltB (MBOAT superfamily)